jgi:ligand-binding sensor domain-containing protein
VFKIREDDKGNLFAATNGGLFRYNAKAKLWMKVLPTKMDAHLNVYDLDLSGPVWFLATAEGVYQSHNAGASWAPATSLGQQTFISVRANGALVAAAGYAKVYESQNDGKSWQQMQIPNINFIRSMTVDANGYVWLNSPQGVFHQVADGWAKARELPHEKVAALDFDSTTHSVVAIDHVSNSVLATADGRHWHEVFNPGVPVRSVVFTGDQVFAGTKFDGVLKAQVNESASETDVRGK